jgi:Fic family protein
MNGPSGVIVKAAEIMNPTHLVPELRKRLVKLPPPFDAHFGVVPLPPTDKAINLRSARSAHAAALAGIGKADALAQSNPSHFFLSRILVRQEAVASSAIEGTFSTLDHLLEVEEDDPLLQQQADADAKQVKSYALALESALADFELNRLDAFYVGMIRNLQREVVKDDPNYEKKHRHKPGQFRKRGTIVFIGGGGDISRSIYNPAPPEHVASCMASHIEYLRCGGMQQANQSIITRVAIAHAHFEAVHPFPDGNGRTGRLLLPLMMTADGHTPLYVAPYIAANKATYIDALRAAQQRLEPQPLIEFMSQAIVASVDKAISAHQELANVLGDWHSRREWRANSAPLRALSFLIGHPVITIKRLQQHLGVSKQAAGTAVKQLVANGILKEKTGFRRNQVFAAEEVLRVYNKPD